MVSGLLDRAWSAVLGRISGLPAECSAVLVEPSVQLAFWAAFGAGSGRFKATFGTVRPSKIVLPPRREANFSVFVLTRYVHPSDGLLDPILALWGPSWAPFWASWGSLGPSWGAGPRTPRAPKRLQGAPWSCPGPWSGCLGSVGGLFEPCGASFGPPFGHLFGAPSVLFRDLRLSTCRSTAPDKACWPEPLHMQTYMLRVLGRRRTKVQ